MIKTKKRTIEVDVCDDMLCNKCGKSFYEKNGEPEGLIDLRFTGGYYSQYFGDMTSIKFDICEKCLYEWVEAFKISAYED